MAFRRDSHGGGVQGTSQVVINSLSGGLNLLDNPLTVSENDLLVAKNVQYRPAGYAIETRDPLSGYLVTDGAVIQQGSELYIFNTSSGVMFCGAGGKVYSMPSARPGYTLSLLACSDFTWFVCGVFRVNENPERSSQFV